MDSGLHWGNFPPSSIRCCYFIPSTSGHVCKPLTFLSLITTNFIHSLLSCTHHLLPSSLVHARNSSMLLHIILLCTKTPQTRVKRFLSKNQISRVGEKYSNKMSTIRHLQPTTVLHLEHFVQYTIPFVWQ